MLNKLRDLLKDPKLEPEKAKSGNNQSSENFTTYSDAEGKQFVSPFLSLVDNESILDAKREILTDDLSSLPPLTFGEITIDRIYIYLNDDEIEVSSFIRNGTGAPISFNAVSLGIVDSKNNLVAQEVFAFGEIGIIPPGGARPYNFKFSAENVFIKEFDQKDCHIVFQPEAASTNTKKVTTLKLMNPPPWISEEQLAELEGYISQLPVVLEGELNIAGIDARYVEDQGLDTLIILRNGHKEPVNLGDMPLAVIDLEGNELAAGVFNLSHLSVEASSAMILSLTFDKSICNFEGEPDLSAWAVVLMDINNDDLAS